MTKLISGLFANLVASIAFAQAPGMIDPETVVPDAAKRTAPGSMVLPAVPADTSCESKAVGKNGLPLNRTAKAAFIKKCEAEATRIVSANCEAKAVGQDGKRLAGPARASFLKQCQVDAKGKKQID